jgi:hypothetical protein
MVLYCANISFEVDSLELIELFSLHGDVKSARIIRDQDTKRSRGFAFVEMPDRTEALAAIVALNGSVLDGGREMHVSEANSKPQPHVFTGVYRTRVSMIRSAVLMLKAAAPVSFAVSLFRTASASTLTDKKPTPIPRVTRKKSQRRTKGSIHKEVYTMPEMFQVSGLTEVVDMLRNAPQTIVATGYVKAISAGANVLAAGIESICPVKKEDTGGILERGELREGISVDVQSDSQLRGGIGRVGWTTKRLADTAKWVEYGHRVVVPGGTYKDNRGRVHKGTHTKDVPAYPFIRPGFDNSAEAAVDAVVESLDATVKEHFATKAAA